MKATIKIIILLFFVSCTVMYRTNDVTSKIDQANSQAETFYTQANLNFQKVHQLQQRLKSRRVNFKKVPFKSMQSNYLSMKKVMQKIANMNVTMKSKGDTLKNALHGKGKITSQDPAYSMMRDYRSYMEGASGEYNRLGSELNNLGKDYTKMAQGAGIHEVSAIKLRSQVDSGLKSIKDKSMKADRTIKWARTMLHRFPKEERLKKKSYLDQMDEILKRIAKDIKIFSPLVRKFRKEVGTDEKVMILPNMASHTIISKLKSHIQVVNGLAAKFNTIVSRFQEAKK
ncbi:MAG: hypothetical protein KC493_10725 [Bacteriovoracaceae bacterium]|nr:hypothetical protein [Bacteriovoracaceae bacterium]